MKEVSKETPATPQQISPPRAVRTVWKRFLPLVVFAPVLLLVYALIRSVFSSPDEPEIAQGGRIRAIQLDVLNGSGETGLAQRMTEYLRSRGFDVVEMGNFKTSDVEETMVFDRVGNLEAAQRVATAIGVSEERVQQQLDKSLYLDVSVIIGKDYQRLKAFQ